MQSYNDHQSKPTTRTRRPTAPRFQPAAQSALTHPQLSQNLTTALYDLPLQPSALNQIPATLHTSSQTVNKQHTCACRNRDNGKKQATCWRPCQNNHFLHSPKPWSSQPSLPSGLPLQHELRYLARSCSSEFRASDCVSIAPPEQRLDFTS